MIYKFTFADDSFLEIEAENAESWGEVVFYDDPEQSVWAALSGYGCLGNLIDIASVTPNDVHCALMTAGIDFEATVDGEPVEFQYPAITQ